MLFVGSDKTQILRHLPRPFLFLHDEAISVSRTKLFNHTVHTFNPLKTISYRGAKDFLTLLGSIFPQGENTLTRKNSDFVLLKALLDNPRSLDRLIRDDPKDPATHDAYQKIQTLLLSPVLNRVLTTKGNTMPFTGSVVAPLNRKDLGDFDAFALGNFLISQFQGTIVIPDYGFYAAPHHISLIRENRLIAQVNYLDELPENLRNLFLLQGAVPAMSRHDDAETLALQAGLTKGSNEFTDYVYRSIHIPENE